MKSNFMDMCKNVDIDFLAGPVSAEMLRRDVYKPDLPTRTKTDLVIQTDFDRKRSLVFLGELLHKGEKE
jgi:hypothetical protein